MNRSTSMQFSSTSQSNVGHVRSINEDSYIDSSAQGLWAVADGMGGHQSGDLASQLITQSLSVIQRQDTLENTISKVMDCLLNLNCFLMEEASLRKGHQTIGSTVVVLVSHLHNCAVLWVGDSRLYRLREGTLELITKDHSQVQELVDAGALSHEDAKNHPAANIITRAVGASNDLQIDIKTFSVQGGDVFLLCSDGLYNELNEEEIAASLRQHHHKKACDELIEMALTRSCRDNITAIVIETIDTEKTLIRNKT